jgi:hypothetical protein
MRLNKLVVCAAVASVALLGAAPVKAQGSVSFGFSNFGRCGSGFGLGFTIPLEPRRCWVPGHYETVCEQVWVQGATRQVWVGPVYQTCTDPCGNTTRHLVRAGYWQTVQDAGHYETRYVQVWVPGHYR